jgi:putative transposase
MIKVSMARKFSFAPDEFYHAYNRGNDKRFIFMDDHDKDRFQKLLYLCNGTAPLDFRELPKGPTFGIARGESLTDIGAYCLMYNHFHLLLHERAEKGISRFMQKLSTAFVMYFNTRHGRSGTLFEGKFKAVHADNDPYLEYLFAYIHLNPVEHIEPTWKEDGLKDITKAKQYLGQYKYSSYQDYQTGFGRPESTVLNYKAFPEYFQSVRDFDSYHSDWLRYNEETQKPEGQTFV